ncbi:MAG: T9SS type A sorting domain-containing protein [Fluviicola sp.]|nr:T9SS type A sorting domain-containing protein [Fluviicola sp.]
MKRKTTLSLSFIILFGLSSQAQFSVDTLPTRPQYNVSIHDPAIEIDQSNGTIYYGGTDGVYTSTNQGVSWTYAPIVRSVNSAIVSAQTVEVNQANGNIFVGHKDYGVWKSTDGGANFVELHPSGAEVHHVDVNGTVFVGNYSFTDGNFAGRTNNGIGVMNKVIDGPFGLLYGIRESFGRIYVSEDAGASWALKYTTTNDVKYIGLKSNNELFFTDEFEGMYTTDTSFTAPALRTGARILNGVNANGFMLFVRGIYSCATSMDFGTNTNGYLSGEYSTIFNGIPYPVVDPSGNDDNLDAYNDKIYQTSSTGLVYVYQGGVASLNENTLNKFEIYPNPSSSFINIQSEENITNIEILNMQGQLVAKANSVTSVNIQDLKPGVYFVRVNIDGSLETKRFIKE